MKQKYSIIGLFLIALTACGAKTIENKHKQQVVVAEKIEDSSVSAEHHANKDALPAYIDSYSKADSTLVCGILQDMTAQRHSLSHEELILTIARKFIGVPYVAHTLDKNDEERLVVNLHGLDCTTYVEAVTALMLCAERGKHKFSDYVHQLELIRYRGGKMSYVNRLHYFHWWLEDNVRMGFVKEINTPNPPFTAVQTLKINYMSLNAKAYDMLKNNPRRVAELKKLEDASNGTKVRYIPTALLNNNNELREVIHDGDIIAIVTNKRELDTTHLGFAVWHEDGLHLMNASSLKKNGNRVVEPTETFYQYMTSRPSNIGIRVVRIK